MMGRLLVGAFNEFVGLALRKKFTVIASSIFFVLSLVASLAYYFVQPFTQEAMQALQNGKIPESGYVQKRT
jgi:hypothetical protein